MELYTVINQRRTIRDLQDKEIPMEKRGICINYD